MDQWMNGLDQEKPLTPRPAKNFSGKILMKITGLILDLFLPG